MGFAMVLGQLWLGIEQIHLAGPTMLKQADNRLGLASMVGIDGGQRILASRSAFFCSRKVRQSQRTKSTGILP
jgi:hypothetical protein